MIWYDTYIIQSTAVVLPPDCFIMESQKNHWCGLRNEYTGLIDLYLFHRFLYSLSYVFFAFFVIATFYTFSIPMFKQ